MPHKNILIRKLCQVEITVHVLLIKRLLTMHIATETAKCKQTCAEDYPLQSEVSAHAQKSFPVNNTLRNGC